METNVSAKILEENVSFFPQAYIIVVFRGRSIIILTSLFDCEESLQHLSNIAAFTERDKDIWIFLPQAVLL